ncbi:MAG TPA: isoprenylcysteine carboxylmethyltransferase family protein [Sedimentibacter sp.]|nr:isoprenylcysteine carboxylmethyltransferase family protein [Sedimentibacter sp.]
MDKRKLLKQTLIKFASGVTGLGLILFLSAGTFAWWNAWVFMAVIFLPMTAVGTLLFLKEPELLEKRINMKETEKEQKRVISLTTPLLLAGYIVSGIDFRSGWSHVPLPLVAASFVIVFLGYGLFAYVLKTNSYASRTVNIQENQKLIDYGPYKAVRHPMYTASIMIFVTGPLSLGSWPGFFIMLAYPFLLKKRIDNEEDILTEGLAGYKEYKNAVSWRLIPYIW